MTVKPGVWIVGPGYSGEYWPVQDEIFQATYRKLQDASNREQIEKEAKKHADELRAIAHEEELLDGESAFTHILREIATWIDSYVTLPSASGMREFVIEWHDDLDETCCATGWVHCKWCDGGGKINADGKASKRYPPTHRPECRLRAALEASGERGEGASLEGQHEVSKHDLIRKAQQEHGTPAVSGEQGENQ